MGARLWLRWSWRDLRKRVPQVAAIATIIALGAGIYVGLATTSVWRRHSLNASFARFAAHDVRISLLGGLTIERSRLDRAIDASAASSVTYVETRLVEFAPVTARKAATSFPAAGEIVGVDLRTGPQIDRWRVTAGRNLTPTDAGVALLDMHFAQEHHLPATGTIRVGKRDVRYVGLALSPAYLNLSTTSGEAIEGAATRAVLYAPIAFAREIGRTSTDAVNDAVITARPGVDIERLKADLEHGLAGPLANVAFTVTARNDEPSVRALYDEIASEQHLFDVFALLILAGAGFAAFNLTKRVVEAQRRDIGIAMALGVPRSKIAIRPMLLAAEITIAGVALGACAGWLIAAWVLSVIRARAPLPVWDTPFQTGLFIRGALLGLTVPLVASTLPVWRAVRVQPVDALLPPHLRRGGQRLSHVLRRVRLPGTITLQAPVRRLVRAPTRSILTIVAISFVMAPLLAAFGATDSATATIDTGERVLNGRGGDRLLVDLAIYQPATSTLVTSIQDMPLVERATSGLNTGGFLIGHGKTLGVSIAMVDLHDPIAAPASLAARNLPSGGIVISNKAAADLRARLGGMVTLRHPQRVGAGFRFVDSRLPITAIHSSPYRFVAYMDLRDELIMGLDNIVNTLKVQPKAGASMPDLQRQIAELPGVASALPASSLSKTMRNLLSIVGNLFIILQVVIASLAFLVAFNASNIGADERTREHATMFAFGVRIQRVAFMSFTESLILGTLGVALGLGLGVAVLQWILHSVFPAAVPDLAVLERITTSSYLVTVGIGVLAAATAPWFNVRRLRAMNLPSTLRYVE